jgi:diguanylate cyclase (GGDEF)-like protein
MLPLADRHGEPVTIFALDIDGLKEVNDRHGHAAGDALIAAGADLLRGTFRASDTIARVGGDEFGVLCYGSCDAEAIRDRLAAPDDDPSSPRFSVGSATSAGGAPHELEALLAAADARMYEDKTTRRRSAVAGAN